MAMVGERGGGVLRAFVLRTHHFREFPLDPHEDVVRGTGIRQLDPEGERRRYSVPSGEEREGRIGLLEGFPGGEW
jgi:hypothetical protein